MDGYRCHYSYELVEAASALGVLLVCLPANATHLLQPLDVSVFSALKRQIRSRVHSHMLATGSVNFSKADAITIGSKAWKECNFSKNIVSGFRTAGLFPPSRVNMELRFDRFKHNGVARSNTMAKWLQFKKIVETEVLTLLVAAVGKRKRKTVDVAGRLLTAAMLHEDVDTPRARRARTAQEESAPSPVDP